MFAHSRANAQLKLLSVCVILCSFLFQVITQSHALNVLNNKKGRDNKRDKHGATPLADQCGSAAPRVLASDVSDGTEEAEHAADDPAGVQLRGALAYAADADVDVRQV